MKHLLKLPLLALTLVSGAIPLLAHDQIRTVTGKAAIGPKFGIDNQGNTYFPGPGCMIQVVNAVTGKASPFAGIVLCGYSGDGGPALNAQLNQPGSIAFDLAGNGFVADTYNCAIRRIDAKTHIITTIAGGLMEGSICRDDYEGFRGDGNGGPAIDANLFYPTNAGLDVDGNIYINDHASYAIREIFAKTGIIDTIYGGSASYIGNGVGSDGPPQAPAYVDVDPNGNLFIADPGSMAIFWHTPTGAVIDIAGIITYNNYPFEPCPGSYYGDGGSALEADFNVPLWVVQDKVGNFYVWDSCNNRTRQISAFPGYGLSTGGLTFGTQKVGMPSATQTIRVGAIGPTKINLIVLSHGFTETDTCAHTELAAGQSCLIHVTFDPSVAGTVTGRLRIYSNAFFGRGNPDEVSLTGVGVK